MITLYGFGRVHPLVHGLTRDLRVQWALEELGLPYQVNGLDHTAGEMRSDDFRRISPFQQLPLVDDDGFLLSESGEILLYLAEKAGALATADIRGRAIVSRWCFVTLSTVEPPIQTISLMDFENKTDEVTQARRAGLVQWCDRVLTGVEDRLDQHAHLAGDDFTVADILMTTVLRLARRSGLLASYPRCEAYRLRCEARPAWARTVEQYEARLGAEPGAVARAAEPR